MRISRLPNIQNNLSTQPDVMNIINELKVRGVSIYPNSVQKVGDVLFFIGRQMGVKYLFLILKDGIGNSLEYEFEGDPISYNISGQGFHGKHCLMNHHNAKLLREIFPFTRPIVIGLSDSFGFGDRLGIANPAHLRSLAGSHMRPILAQQSIRELDRTKRTADEVLDAATWAVFQEGYNLGFGADADHLKTTDDIDRYAKAGFTMYTFDPSPYVVNEAVKLSETELRQRARQIETGDFNLDDCLTRYANKTFHLEDGTVLQPSTDNISRAFVKYGGAILHTKVLYRYLKDKYSNLPTEVELSVDETDVPTTPIEHLFIAAELKRLGLQWVSLAPRFIGDFEKGVDYRGDLNAFAAEYKKHAYIAKMFGPYKISIHSGSDKFSVYKTIGSLSIGNVHVKTAGTSYLEALRTIAMVDSKLLREILDFARDNYETARQSYHVTAQLSKVPSSNECTDQQLKDLFDQHDARQVFHVTFGQVLSTVDKQNRFLFRDRIMAVLDQNENVHYENIIKHFRKHLDPFVKT